MWSIINLLKSVVGGDHSHRGACLGIRVHWIRLVEVAGLVGASSWSHLNSFFHVCLCLVF